MKLLRNEGRDKLCLEREYLENIIENFFIMFVIQLLGTYLRKERK